MAPAGCPSRAPDEDRPQAQGGDAAGLQQLYDQLLATIRRRWRGADVEDVVQDAFLRLSMAENRTEVLDKAAFLYVTAFNLVRDRVRAEVTRGSFLADAGYLGQVTCADPSTEQILAARERLAIVDAAIAELPLNARTAFVMHRFDNLPHAQIAEELSISVSMVEKHVRRALTHCRGRLAEMDNVG